LEQKTDEQFAHKNIAFSRKDARERAICTKLSRSKILDFFHAFEVR